MKNQTGVTMITLITTVMIIMILVGITGVTSMRAYEKMRYEKFIAELEEIQKKVDEICADYQLAKKTLQDINYETYFKDRFDESFPRKLAVVDKETDVATLVKKYSLVDNGYTFYFDGADIKKYFNLKGIDKAVVVDFSTRYVYSVEGCKDPNNEDENNKNVKHYTLAECLGDKIFLQNEEATKSTSESITVTPSKKNVGDITLYEVTLTLNREVVELPEPVPGIEQPLTGKDYNIKKAYYSKDGENWIEVEYLGDYKYSSTHVSFIIYEEGTYFFKVEDTSGKMVMPNPTSITLDSSIE